MSDTKTRVAWVPFEPAYDDSERVLLQRIDEIRREYEAAIKPYVDALVRSRQCKPTRYYMQVDLLSGEPPR